MLGPDAVIGVSCYASLDLAREAATAGADYVGFGSFHASPTKPQAVRAPQALLREARHAPGLPVAAIGGITAANGRPLIEAGADLLAVISGVFGTDDIEGSARAIASLFTGNEP
jgi:thiamine-phosphate pyrophosphorylase